MSGSMCSACRAANSTRFCWSAASETPSNNCWRAVSPAVAATTAALKIWRAWWPSEAVPSCPSCASGSPSTRRQRLLTPPPVEAVALGALQLTPGVAIRDVLQHGVSLRFWISAATATAGTPLRGRPTLAEPQPPWSWCWPPAGRSTQLGAGAGGAHPPGEPQRGLH